MRNPPSRKSRAWQRLRAQVIAESNGICGYCRRPVDRSLSGRHPDGPSVDHIVALVDGGMLLERANLMLVHVRCNSAKENRRRAQARHNVSRVW